MTVYNDTLTQAIGASATLRGAHGPVVRDTIEAGSTLGGIRAVLPVVSETVNVAPVLTHLLAVALADVVGITPTEFLNGTYHLGVAEGIEITENLFKSFPGALAETIDFEVEVVAQMAAVMIERLGLTDLLVPALTYNQSIAERITATAAIAAFFGGDVTETMQISEVLLSELTKTATLSETIEVTESASPQFILRVITEDSFQIDDADLPQMIFNGLLEEAIDISGAYVEPNGSVTTWVMNTRTAALTEYIDYNFNSFARMGNKYLGASENGLYELLGDDDDGRDTYATIRSGFAQWGGTRFTTFKAAYLGVRGDGDYTLRIFAGADGDDSDEIVNYRVTSEGMRTTKVNMGKGLKARYFAFELIVPGQDFDLDSIEFVPLVHQRRV